MTERSILEARFHGVMLDLYRSAGVQCGYWANRFLQLTRRVGGVQAAKRLVRQPGLSSGLRKVAEAHLLHLSVEATVLRPEWAVLFTDEERAMAAHKVELAREHERSLATHK